MKVTRNFRLNTTQSVLLPPAMGSFIVAGEACTEIGCDGPGYGATWFERWLHTGRRWIAGCKLERNRHGTQP